MILKYISNVSSNVGGLGKGAGETARTCAVQSTAACPPARQCALATPPHCHSPATVTDHAFDYHRVRLSHTRHARGAPAVSRSASPVARLRESLERGDCSPRRPSSLNELTQANFRLHLATPARQSTTPPLRRPPSRLRRQLTRAPSPRQPLGGWGYQSSHLRAKPRPGRRVSCRQLPESPSQSLYCGCSWRTCHPERPRHRHRTQTRRAQAQVHQLQRLGQNRLQSALTGTCLRIDRSVLPFGSKGIRRAVVAAPLRSVGPPAVSCVCVCAKAPASRGYAGEMAFLRMCMCTL